MKSILNQRIGASRGLFALRIWLRKFNNLFQQLGIRFSGRKYYYLKFDAPEHQYRGYYISPCKTLNTGQSHLSLDGWNSRIHLLNDEFPDFTPDLDFELKKGSRLTDVIYPSQMVAQGLLINKRTRDLISKFALMPHEYFDATVAYGGKQFAYYWLHLADPNQEYITAIDLDESKLFFCDWHFRRIREVEIREEGEEWWDVIYRNPSKTITARKLVFDKSFQLDDLFIVTGLDEPIFISKKLALVLLKRGITGIRIKKQYAIR